MKVLSLFLFLLFGFNYGSSRNIECNYVTEHGNLVLGEAYRCHVKNNLYINSPYDSHISLALGQHEYGKSNDDMIAIMIYQRETEYFPQGLNNIFKNLKSIDVCYGRLKEIKKYDLEPFPQLINLNLANNDIAVLEEGLFSFNPHMKLIWLQNNKINIIESNIFTNLNLLDSIRLEGNKCINMGCFQDSVKTEKIIKYVQEHCTINKCYEKCEKTCRISNNRFF